MSRDMTNGKNGAHPSNYEVTRRRMQAQFAALDFRKIAEVWALDWLDGGLYADLVSRRFRIDDKTGAVTYIRGGEEIEADYNAAMTLYDILTRERAQAAGTYSAARNFSALQTGSMLENGFFGGFRGIAEHFDGKTALLSEACRRLGGEEFGIGDVHMKVPVFRDLCVAVQFWDSDEDFPATLNMLLDDHILQFMHYETAMYLSSHLAKRIEEEAAKIGISGGER